MAFQPTLRTYRRRNWRNDMEILTDTCRKILNNLSRLKDMQNVGQKKKNSTADDSYGEIYLYSDDEVEVIPYKKKPPEVVTLNENGEIVPEADDAADIEQLKNETLETLAIIHHEIEACNDVEQRKEFHLMLEDIKKKLNDFGSGLSQDN